LQIRRQDRIAGQDGGYGTERVPVENERRRQRSLEEPAVRELLELARRVEAHFGSPQDVEWAIDAAGELLVVQSRPVTGLPERTTAPRPASAMALVMGTFGVRPTEKD